MTLFNDKEIFTSGTRGRKVFDIPDADLMLFDNFFSKDESDRYYEMLLNKTPWREYEMPMYDKVVTAPRMICWYEDSHPSASGTNPNLTPELSAIRDRVEVETGTYFNAVLLNLYRNGRDGVSWHSDKEGKSGENPIIASVTFGETRMFRLRHKMQKHPQLEIPLYHGSLLVMAGTTNTFWEHHVPKTTRDVLPRINLTFRQVKFRIG